MALEFLADQGASLSSKEQAKALRWHEMLRKDKEDPDNVKHFLYRCDVWLQKTLAATQGYCELSAVGSVLDSKPEYGDIDFILISDLPLGAFNIGNVGYTKEYGLATELEGKHWVKEADEIEAYRALLQNFPDRGLWNVTPFHPSGSRYSLWTKIHLILQTNVPSIEQWNSQDRFDKVPLLRKFV